ncbi:DUF3126 family protein [Candidatus Liberibacter asiaticus]|uniref:DUF3126 family protein n=3 Tax=Liberibacter asiaticus TaxID=34021 RepID=C6XH93_LIBAP|nr:DUF3126 family protein [Candidatus Liberibacter asiaticus]ACT56638.1 hypothetical protein CLIBASIA_00240 [Candidatus Liberibacter asiaticus str. psy62]AGH16405.1 hypothetical protein WSI_00150 [Candidatus Liberibacter asiaticus str. gxpsy]ALK07741.2 DUF3126 family protein [Candidatus Liberibacter asiaticus]AWL13611.1 DUF3126 domain-containing protein [Candidatus Liberibacter asiaticus]MBA2916948.1 DUF3126 family protein [Candidatus Liberibacter asiaticus]
MEVRMRADEIKKLERYLKRVFGSGIAVQSRENQSDSVEVLMNSEFIGLVYRNDDEEEISYHFDMSILEDDL